MTDSHPLTVLCLASYFKGSEFIIACKELGCQVFLITKEGLKDEAWPRSHIESLFLMPNPAKQPDITHAVSYLARTNRIDLIIPLDDYDVQTAAALREHLRLPGMGDTLARRFRDKLAMRTTARDNDLPVPEFSGIFNYDQLREFMDRVPPPWVLKPRGEAGAMGIKKINQAAELWPRLDELGDQQSFFLLEAFLPGEVYHVDSIVWQGEVVFSAAHKYGRPPMNVSHEGGVFITRTLPRASEDGQKLQRLNQRLLKAFGLERGVTHAEFIKSEQDGQFYFLETAARVGGANIADVVQFASGISLWAEWANIELAHLAGQPYGLPVPRQDYAAVLICLARQEHPGPVRLSRPRNRLALGKASPCRPDRCLARCGAH